MFKRTILAEDHKNEGGQEIPSDVRVGIAVRSAKYVHVHTEEGHDERQWQEDKSWYISLRSPYTCQILIAQRTYVILFVPWSAEIPVLDGGGAFS